MAVVKVYSTPTCPYCVMAKDYLKKNGVEFEDIDVSQDAAAAEQMIRKSGQTGVPVVEIDGEMIVGFNVPEIKRKLKL
ncbi:NrdH-redoxin [Candidatus Micrarchaeota archaeon CG10_big_fil_rev_8_21_14_0_10_59_7]|nr:MAG: NrdH-redoxin [Candidatus Micrarchaeota archaeon CG10_big_fil_rev_8_21_14_0_10_59_7]